MFTLNFGPVLGQQYSIYLTGSKGLTNLLSSSCVAWKSRCKSLTFSVQWLRRRIIIHTVSFVHMSFKVNGFCFETLTENNLHESNTSFFKVFQGVPKISELKKSDELYIYILIYVNSKKIGKRRGRKKSRDA